MIKINERLAYPEFEMFFYYNLSLALISYIFKLY